MNHLVTIKARQFLFPNFLVLEVPGHTDTVSMDVGAAFPSDQDAGAYWDGVKAAWIEHVRDRRDSL